METITHDIPESEVCRSTGLDASTVRARRGQEGIHWRKGPAGRVLWSQEGVENLRRSIDPSSAEKSPTVAAAQALRVIRARFPNRKILVCEGPDGESVTVALGNNGDNFRFLPGMTVLARHREGAVWDFEGNPENPAAGRRFPRAVGRW
jgi:hypothetical protein